MRKINHRGAEVFVIRELETKYYEFIGPSSALEAVYAYLNSTDVRRNGYTTIGVHLDEHTKYKRFMLRLSTGMYNMALLHPSGLISSEGEYLFISPTRLDDPPENFFDILNSRIRVPILREWENELWKQGRIKKERWYELIEEKVGDGVYGYIVHPEFTDTWESIVLEIINGALSKQRKDGVLSPSAIRS